MQKMSFFRLAIILTPEVEKQLILWAQINFFSSITATQVKQNFFSFTTNNLVLIKIMVNLGIKEILSLENKKYLD